MTAAIFKAARRALGLNQTSLAHALGVSRETVSNWERSTPPRVASLAMETLERRRDVSGWPAFIVPGGPLSSPAKQRAEESGKI